jgi:hypothetical protein
VTGLNAMMRRYLQEAGEWIIEKVGDVADEEETEDEMDDLHEEGGLGVDAGVGNGLNGRPAVRGGLMI